MDLEEMKKWVGWNIILTRVIGCLFIGLVLVIWIGEWSSPLVPSPGQDGVNFVVQSSGEGIVMIVFSVIIIGVAFVFLIISFGCSIYYKRLGVKMEFGGFGVAFQGLASILSMIGILLFAFLVIDIAFG